MSLDGSAVNAAIDAGLSGVALLNASCQAVIEAQIAPVSSPWYDQLDGELGAAEGLVLGWRQSGFLSFRSEILQAVAAAGEGFASGRPAIVALFDALAQDFSSDGRDRLAGMIGSLAPPVGRIVDAIDAYLARQKAFEMQMDAVDARMRSTVAQVQAQEAQIQERIAGINAQVAALAAQIRTDRDAIAKARATRTTGIVETIFGVVFAPLTGGASLILAGIGVASIAGAQEQIDGMQAQIGGFQRTIAADQASLSADQATVATLNALTMSTGLVLSDLDAVEGALDGLRTEWTLFADEFEGVVAKIAAAGSATDLVVARVWFDAACTQWAMVSGHVDDLLGAAVTTTRVPIG